MDAFDELTDLGYEITRWGPVVDQQLYDLDGTLGRILTGEEPRLYGDQGPLVKVEIQCHGQTLSVLIPTTASIWEDLDAHNEQVVDDMMVLAAQQALDLIRRTEA